MEFQNEYTLIVDIKKYTTSIVPVFVQYDAATLIFKIYDDGLVFDLSNFTRAEVAHQLPDRKTVIGDAELITLPDGDKAIQYKYLGSEMSQEGNVITSLSVFNGDEKVSVLPFIVKIVSDLRDSYVENATEEVGLLQELIAKITDSLEIAESNNKKIVGILEDIKESTIFLEDAIIKETERQTKETARIVAENNRNTAETARIDSENTRIVAETIRDSQEQDRQFKDSARDDNESDRITQESQREIKESARIAEETDRQRAESIRNNAEDDRILSETDRKSSEINRNDAELERSRTETIRDDFENERQVNETARITAESLRKESEMLRDSSEKKRESTETSRKSSEDARILNETSRTDAESLRSSAETNRNANEIERKNSEVTRLTSETNRINSESTRITNENARSSNENERIASETIRKSNESDRSLKENARIVAENERIDFEDIRKSNEQLRISNETARSNAETQRITDMSNRVHKKTYSPTVPYVKHNEVNYNGSTWRCLIDNIGEIPEEGQYWTLVAQRGIDGKGSVSTVNDVSPNVYGNVDLVPSDIGAANRSHGHEINEISGLNNQLTNKAEKVHEHSIIQITGLDTQLAAKAEKSDLTTTNSNVSSIQLKVDALGTAATKNTGNTSGNIPVIGADGKLDPLILPTISNAVTSVAGKTGAVILTQSDVGLGNVTNESKATMFTSPTFTGTPIAPTPTAATNNTQIATTAYVTTAITNKTSVTGNAGTATKLTTARTINGVSFDGTANITIVDSTKAPLASPALTGTPTAPTATSTTNTTQIATTAFVQTHVTTLTTDINTHLNDLLPHGSNLSQYASIVDSKGLYTVVELKRSDGTLYMKSTLSKPDSNGNYQTATWQFYATNGTTIALTKVWTIAYDSEGKIISKVIQ